MSSDYETRDKDDDEVAWNSTKTKFDGIKIVDAINLAFNVSYFKIKANVLAFIEKHDQVTK